MRMPGTDLLPPGPLRDLVVAVHQLHAEAGLPSTRKISAAARASGLEPVSHETVSVILRGSALPRWPKLEAVVRQLAEWSPTRTDPDKQVQRFQALWLRASDPSAVSSASSPAYDELPAGDGSAT